MASVNYLTIFLTHFVSFIVLSTVSARILMSFNSLLRTMSIGFGAKSRLETKRSLPCHTGPEPVFVAGSVIAFPLNSSLPSPPAPHSSHSGFSEALPPRSPPPSVFCSCYNIGSKHRFDKLKLKYFTFGGILSVILQFKTPYVHC